MPQATRVVVVDLSKDLPLAEIPDTPGVSAIAINHDWKLGFSSNSRENKVSMVDLEKLDLLKKIRLSAEPGNIVCEPWGREVYIFDALGITLPLSSL